MKIYVPKPSPLIVRLMISKVGSGSKARYVNLEGTNREEAIEYLEKLITQAARDKGLSPFVKGKKTSIVVREYVTVNGPSKSISFYGFEPEEVEELIIDSLKR